MSCRLADIPAGKLILLWFLLLRCHNLFEGGLLSSFLKIMDSLKVIVWLVSSSLDSINLAVGREGRLYFSSSEISPEYSSKADLLYLSLTGKRLRELS
jgi:hypothetical protein